MRTMLNRIGLHVDVPAGPDDELRERVQAVQARHSARAHGRIHKVARTISGLSGIGPFRPSRLAEAAQYRSPDRDCWS